MTQSEPAALHDHAHLTRYASSPGEREQLYRRTRRGELIRIHIGCFVDASFWAGLSPEAQHRGMAHLAGLSFGDELVFSHLTAAALWRLPILGPWPNRVHVAGGPGSGVRASLTLARHTMGLEPTASRIDGLRVTSMATTVAQVASAHSFAAGVVIADAALRRSIHSVQGFHSTVTTNELVAAAERIALNHGGARARSVADFADGRADRPGESLSRVSIAAARLATPGLQVVLYGASGARYVVDFYWPHLKLIGEFDGKAKYEDPEFLRGRTPAQALADEKAREDDLRAAGYNFSRWGWAVAMSPARLATQLRRAGVR